MKKIVFIALIFAMISCHKNEMPPNEIEFINPMEQIGVQHNDDLKYILENLEGIPERGSIKPAIEKVLKTKYISDNQLKSVSTGLSEIPDFPESIDELDLYSWVENFNVSRELKDKLKETLDILSLDYELQELLKILSQKELEAANFFSGTELNAYYSHLAVAKKSAFFWAPESEGGLNGIQYLEVENLKSVQRVNWWKVLGCDCVGGVMGTVMSANPLGGAVGYVGASAISTIMQL